MELGERKQRILTALIDVYVRTGEPVGSKVLVDMLDNAVSSATIRNEMAELAAMGYLEQPHTSAGRIPTAAAFRLYIDSLMDRRALSEDDRREIDTQLKRAAGDPEKLVEEASNVLAETTGCAAVTTTPSSYAADIRRIEVLRVSRYSAALLLMTGSGMLRTRVCRFDSDIENEALETLSCLERVLLRQSAVGYRTSAGAELGDRTRSIRLGLRPGTDHLLSVGSGIGGIGNLFERPTQPASSSDYDPVRQGIYLPFGAKRYADKIADRRSQRTSCCNRQ